MHALNRFWMRIRMLFTRRRAAAQLDDELAFHLERQIAENRAAGMSPAEARTAALRLFGNPAVLRDQARATWSWSSAESLLRDLRYSARTLRRTPGFTLVAILVMALGIGANVALFTVVRGVLLRPLPFQDPNRLMELYESGSERRIDYNVVAGGVYAEWKDHNNTFSDLALLYRSPVRPFGVRRANAGNASGRQISWNLFRTLGVHPALGRDFTAGDDTPSANSTAILSWSLWKRRFGGDPAILNQTVYLDGKPYTIIGVMPEWFAFPDPRTQIWTPVYRYAPPKLMAEIDDHMFDVVGRLKPGVTPQQARWPTSA